VGWKGPSADVNVVVVPLAAQLNLRQETLEPNRYKLMGRKLVFSAKGFTKK